MLNDLSHWKAAIQEYLSFGNTWAVTGQSPAFNANAAEVVKDADAIKAKAELVVDGAILVASLAPQGRGAETLVTVGRWMSREELATMIATERVVESRLQGITSVSFPANAKAYADAVAGSLYVEFQVAREALGAASSTGWAKIYGPNSIFGIGGRITEMPTAANIVVKAAK